MLFQEEYLNINYKFVKVAVVELNERLVNGFHFGHVNTGIAIRSVEVHFRVEEARVQTRGRGEYCLYTVSNKKQNKTKHQNRYFNPFNKHLECSQLCRIQNGNRGDVI
jgi:hypothetical protein